MFCPVTEEEFLLEASKHVREGKEKKRKEKEAWAEKVSHNTPILVATGHTKEGKASSVPQVRTYLKKVKKLKAKVVKEITKENVLEKWQELS